MRCWQRLGWLGGVLVTGLVVSCTCDSPSAEAGASTGEPAEPAASGDVTRDPVSGAASSARSHAARAPADAGGDPLAALEEGATLAEVQAAPGSVEPSEGGACGVSTEARRIWPRPGVATVAAQAGAFTVAGYAPADQGEQVFVVRVPAAGPPSPVQTFQLPKPLARARSAPPGLLALAGGRAALAAIDGEGRLRVASFQADAAGGGALRSVAEHVDPRFAPTLASVDGGRHLLAWTEAGSDAMRVKAAVLDSRGLVQARLDGLTPVSMGAAAPSFVRGATPPVLLMVDAREAYSPLLQVRFDGEARPAEAQVQVPLSMLTTPPSVVAARGARGIEVAYTALGQAATTAVGTLVLAPEPGPVRALVPGTAYGPLAVAATSVRGRAVFAVDAPQRPGRDAPREAHVHAVGADGPAEPTVVRGPEGRARHVALASLADGTLGLVFSSRTATYLVTLRCP